MADRDSPDPEDMVFRRQDIPQEFRQTITSLIDDMLMTGERKLYDKATEETEKALVQRALTQPKETRSRLRPFSALPG